MKLKYTGFAASGALVGALLLSAGCKDAEAPAKPKEAQPPAKVETTPVVSRPFSDKVEALGTVRALEAINISASVTDRIDEMFFEDGDSVKKGTVLVKLEQTEEDAILAGAKAEQDEQEREIQRLQGLVKNGAVSEVRLEEYRTRRDIAIQRVKEVEAQISDRLIVAPFDGVLGFRRMSPGALVSPGELIATLDVLDPVKLDFTVPETFLSDLKSGLEITARTEAFPDDEFIGKVTHVDTRVNPITRSVTVRAEIPNSDRRLRPGMLMTTVLDKNPEKSLSIPERALVSVQAKHFVFGVNKDGDATSPTVSRIPVTIGRRLPGYVELLEGVTEGQTIVSDGLIGLVDGGAVEITGTFKGTAAPYRPGMEE